MRFRDAIFDKRENFNYNIDDFFLLIFGDSLHVRCVISRKFVQDVKPLKFQFLQVEIVFHVERTRKKKVTFRFICGQVVMREHQRIHRSTESSDTSILNSQRDLFCILMTGNLRQKTYSAARKEKRDTRVMRSECID